MEIPVPKKKLSALSPQVVRRKVSSVDQMAQMSSYYNVKSFGSSGDSDVLMKEIERRRSVIGTLLMPMMVPGGVAASTAHSITDGVVRNITVLLSDDNLDLFNYYMISNFLCFAFSFLCFFSGRPTVR